MPNESPVPATPPPTPSPTPMKPSGSSLVWHILLVVLLVAGFTLLFFKINGDTAGIKSDVASLKTENAVLSGKVGAMEEKVGKIEADVAQKAEAVKAIQTTEATEPLQYGPLGNDISVSKKKVDFFSVDELVNRSQGCETNKSIAYFETLAEKYKGVQGTQYTFMYLEPSQDPQGQIITVFPNSAGYKDSASFEADFNICGAGGNTYPYGLSENNLMFQSACGSGYDDGSGLLHGCVEVEKIISQTLKLN